MSLTKKPAEIETMRKAGKILGKVLEELTHYIKPGMTEIELDKKAESLILKNGGEVGFKKVYGYKYATCISVNEEVVHGIPGRRRFMIGDIVCIDCGVYLDGFHTDMAETIQIPEQPMTEGVYKKSTVRINEASKRFLDIGKKALVAGVKQAKAGNRVGHISKAIQDIVEGEGEYHIVTSLIGHGVGRDLHEKPEIPGFLKGSIEKTPLLEAGMTLAIEVIYAMGTSEVIYEGSDDWTIISADGSLSSVFERTILVTEGEAELITPPLLMSL